ncbi:MAG: hypothetical protein WAR57_14275 [Candidatus Phosphoribacter sp.]
MTASLPLLVGPDAVRPSLPWLDRTAGKSRLLIPAMSAREPDGFTEIGQACTRAGLASPDRTQVLFRTAILMAVHGGGVKQVTPQALQDLVAVEERHGHRPGGRATCYRILCDIGAFGADAPSRLASLEHRRQLTCAQLVDRAGVKPGPIRDLLVDYLRERQPALDYTSLAALAYYLVTQGTGKVAFQQVSRHVMARSGLRA